MSIAEALMTAEEFAAMPDDGRRTELVAGRTIELPPPKRGHGKVCYRIASMLGHHVEVNDFGTILINDSGIITRRNPDTVRGADVAYYSYARMPRGPVPDTYGDVAPEVVVEVKSSSDRWPDILAKIAEYLEAGVTVVCLLDPEPRSAYLYYPDRPNQFLGPDDELTFPDCLPDFRVPVRSLFE